MAISHFLLSETFCYNKVIKIHSICTLYIYKKKTHTLFSS